MSWLARVRVVVATCGLLFFAGRPAWGHGQVDQSYLTGGNSVFNCGIAGGSLYQSFTPTVSPLVAVDIHTLEPASTPITLRIRAGSPTGPVLATATASSPSGNPPLHFDLPTLLVVTPGVTLVLELAYPAIPTFHGWSIKNPGGAYPGGQAFGCVGSPVSSGDFLFATYTAGCTPNATTLCLHGARFRVTAAWRTDDGSNGAGRAVQLTNDAGYFWFFDAANVEVLVKMVDACSFNDRFWVFSAGLTNVRVDLDVLDTVPEAGKSYLNPLGRPYPPILDTNAFATCP